MGSDEDIYDVDDAYGDDEDGAMEGDDDDYYDYDGEWQPQVEDSAPPERPLEFTAIKKESLSVAQQQDLAMVMGVFNIKQHHARALLIHYRWNTDRLNDHLDRKGQDRMLMEAGVVLQENNSSRVASSPARSKAPSPKKVTCMVCFEGFSPRATSAMDCGHSFCNDCWTGYFVAAVDSGKKQIRCMEVKCPAICDEDVVLRLLSRRDPAAAERLRYFLLQSYVDDNTAVKWCPSAPHCGRAIRLAASEAEPLCEVECPCGISFCFRCAAATPHSPCPCVMWERWEIKGQSEAENVKWLLVNTKNCPKCFRPIIKGEGCNLMTCNCGQYFCWLCGGATGGEHTWTSISGHSCNRFEEKEKHNKHKVDNAKRQLRRYEHYYDRFQNHSLSRKTEREKLGPDVAERVRKLEAHDSILIKDASWLAGAHRSLLRCRRVLAQSYVFAYYMFDGEETPTRAPEPGSLTMAQRQNLFEDYQEQVEGNVERLSQLLGKDMADELLEEEIMKVRQDTVNLVKIVETHCGKMYGCIQDELLPILVEPMSIAAYQPGGPSKARELPV